MLPNEKHEFSGGWRAAQKGGLAGYTTKQASGLHIKLGCGKGRVIGLPFSAVCPALFRSPPDSLFVQPAPVFCAVHHPAKSSHFSFGNMGLQPAGPPISFIQG